MAHPVPYEIKGTMLNEIGKVQRADLTCDVIKKITPFVLTKL